MPYTNRDEIEKLEALYASNPAGRVFTHLAEAYRKAGELERADEILARGLELHPDYPSAHVVLGRVKTDQGLMEEAESAFRRVLELDRHNLVALKALAGLAEEGGRYAEALHYLGELGAIDPSDTEAAERLERLAREVPAEEPAMGFEAEAEPAMTDSVGAGDAAEGVLEEEAIEVGAEPALPEVAAAGIEAPAPGTAGPEGGEFEAVEPGALDPDLAERAAATLDAWVESLEVLGPEVDEEGLESGAGDAPSAFAEAWLAETEAVLEEVHPGGVEADRGARVEAGAEGEEAHLEAEVAYAVPGEGGPAAEGVGELEADVEIPEPADAGMGAERVSEEELGLVAKAGPGAPEEVGIEAPPGGSGEPVSGIETEAPGLEAAGTEPGPESGAADRVASETELASAWWGDPELHGNVPDPVEWVSQEEWEQVAAYGWAGAGREEEKVEPVPRIDADWDIADRDEDADEVATETLAEVYAAQGFKAEAAGIYRKLLRRRPDDPRLLSRLAALEEVQPAATPAEEEAGDAGAPAQSWVEGVESTWPGGEEQAVAGPTPYAWLEAGAAEGPEGGETIGDRLRGMLAWRPESAPEPEALLPGFPTFPAEPGPAAGTRTEAEGDDLEMFRSWLRSLRK